MVQATIDWPFQSITDAFLSLTAGIQARKTVRHQSQGHQLFDNSTTVVAQTRDLVIVRGATGTLLGLQACINGTIATGGDRTVTIDLQKSTGAGAFATVLSSTIQFTNASVLRTVSSAVLSNTSIVAGDILRTVVTVAGSASAQAVGLLCTLTWEETWS